MKLLHKDFRYAGELAYFVSGLGNVHIQHMECSGVYWHLFYWVNDPVQPAAKRVELPLFDGTFDQIVK